VVARVRGTQSRLPPYMVIGGKLHQGKRPIIGEGGGTLGAMYDPFRLEYDPVQGTRIPALQLPPGLTPERLNNRQRLVAALDNAHRRTDMLRSSRAIDAYRAQAFAMLTSPASRRMFDLSREPRNLVERYVQTRFGQSCLLTRRPIENGVPFM